MDGEQVWLYSGFATKIPRIASGFHDLDNKGGVVLELEKDMLTIKQGPKLLFPRKGLPGAFDGHAFFEASSIRKIEDKYCFVYSSEHNHDLCYAVSDRPDGPFEFKGVLVDIGDVFLNGRNDEKNAVNYLGNTHGGLLNIGDQWYIFYHRQTNRHSYSRQACAEKLNREEDGSFLQAEITSCGLNEGPLPGTGRYDAYIACNLMGKEGALRVDIPNARKNLKNHPYFTQKGKDWEYGVKQYIANMQDGSTAGYKYFSFSGKEKRISVTGKGEGCFLVTDGEKEAAIVGMNQTADFKIEKGIKALFFRYIGKDAADFESFTIE